MYYNSQIWTNHFQQIYFQQHKASFVNSIPSFSMYHWLSRPITFSTLESFAICKYTRSEHTSTEIRLQRKHNIRNVKNSEWNCQYEFLTVWLLYWPQTCIRWWGPRLLKGDVVWQVKNLKWNGQRLLTAHMHNMPIHIHMSLKPHFWASQLTNNMYYAPF